MEKLKFSKCIIDGVEVKRCRKTIHSYKMHLHNELSIGYIEKGSTTVTLGEKEFKFKAGDGMAIPPLMSHMCCPDDIENWQTVILYIDPKYYENAADFPEALKLSDECTEKLIKCIYEMDNARDETYIENLLVELLIDFEALARKPDETDAKNTVEEILEYIKENFLENISLKHLEDIFGISKFTMIRNFKKKYNTTPAAYQLQMKVAEAKDMLSADYDVMDICDALKFYDQAHFIREFKKMNGITPAAYKKELFK